MKLIGLREGVVLKGYKDSAGLLTVGIGHLVKPGEPFKLGQPITQDEAYRLLQEDLAIAEIGVDRNITAELNQNQFDALVSFTFNLGTAALGRSSLRKKLNAGDVKGAANAFLLYNKDRDPRTGKLRVNNGLVRRRREEKEQFLTPPSSTVVMRPDGEFAGEVVAVLETPSSPSPVPPQQENVGLSTEQVVSAIKGTADVVADVIGHTAEKTNETEVKVSKSSWATVGVTKLVGLIAAILGFMYDHWVYVLIGGALIAAAVWYLSRSKDRGLEKVKMTKMYG